MIKQWTEEGEGILYEQGSVRANFEAEHPIFLLVLRFKVVGYVYSHFFLFV